MQRPFLFLSLMVAILRCGPTKAGAQEEVENPVYKNWSQFKPGSSVAYRSVTVTPEFESTQEYTLTLKEVTPQKLVIERVLVAIMPDGTRMEYPAMESENPKSYKLPKGAPKPDPTKSVGVKEKGEEELELLGKKFKTEWYKAVSKVEAGDTFTKSWTCKEIPGGLVKATNETPATKSINTVEMISLEIKE